jgi:predicted acylesterase/phospholipase RssA
MLYSQMYYGTKDLVVEYIKELESSIGYLARAKTISQETKEVSFHLFKRNLGEPALCLSGGATFSYRHFGVVKALLEQGLLPNIVAGTSGGGLVAALVCTRTNEELKDLLVPELSDKITACWEPFPFWIRRWYRTGARFDSVDWARRCCWFTRGSMTFREAYERTGKILNISTVPADPHSPAILCNYITCPNAVIWSALLASAAVPGILNPVVLMTKTTSGDIRPFSFGSKWKDGSLRTDIPIQALNTYFNVNFTIVSQVNPHIALFMYGPRGAVGRPVSHRKGKGWRGGFVGSALENMVKLEIRKWLKLVKDLNLLPRLMDQDWSNIWLQQFKGTVTLFPRMGLKDFWYILADPDREKLAAMITAGKRSTFPKILFIKHYFEVYRSIERASKTIGLVDRDSPRWVVKKEQTNTRHYEYEYADGEELSPLTLPSEMDVDG